MRVYPAAKPGRRFAWGRPRPLDFSRFGYSEEVERHNRFHPLNLHMGLFVFMFDAMIMMTSLVFNELLHAERHAPYHSLFIVATLFMSALKLVLYVSTIVIERKESALLVSLNSKKLFSKNRNAFFCFYVLLSLANHLPISPTASFYKIQVYVRPIDGFYEYYVHDFFTLISIVRAFSCVLFVLNYFTVNQTKYRRVVAKAGIDQYNDFTLRYFFKTYPIHFSFIFLLLFVVAAALTIRIIERSNPVKDFSSLNNSVYFIMVTMATLGYGDYTPLSDIGRMVTLFIMIVGLITINLINSAMINYLRMSVAEEKSLSTFIKMELKEQLVVQYISLFLYIRRNNRMLKHGDTFLSRLMSMYYMNKMYKCQRRLRQLKVKYDKLKFFMSTEKNGTLKKSLEFKFSIFSSNLDFIKKNTVAINQNLFSQKPEDLSISTRLQSILHA